MAHLEVLGSTPMEFNWTSCITQVDTFWSSQIPVYTQHEEKKFTISVCAWAYSFWEFKQ